MPPKKRGSKSRDVTGEDDSGSSAVLLTPDPLPLPLTTRESVPRALAAMSRQSSRALSISSSSSDSASKGASTSQDIHSKKRRRISKEVNRPIEVEAQEDAADSTKNAHSSETEITIMDSKKEDAQKSPAELLSSYSCPICFSTPTNATLTPCGHICCGECLFTAVRTTVQRAYTLMSQEQPLPRCPVCRAVLKGWDGKGGGVIGLKAKTIISL